MAWVQGPTNKLILRFLDDNQRHASLIFNVPNTDTNPGGGGPAAIASAAAALSKSALIDTEIQIIAINSAPGSPTTGPYDRPADKAFMGFSAADGTRPHIKIGAPNEVIFSDGWNLDGQNPQLIAFVNAMKAHAKTASGAAITGIVTGNRMRPPRRKGQ